MIFWFLVILMTGISVACIYLAATGNAHSVDLSNAHDELLYHARMDEINADLKSGRLDGASAESARIEEARKLLRLEQTTSPAQTSYSPAARPVALYWTIFLVPVVALCVYSVIGNPDQAIKSDTHQVSADLSNETLPNLLKAAEARLKSNPKDAQGWIVVAPVYVRLGRFDDAINAYKQALELLGRRPGLTVAQGEAMVMKSQGRVSLQALALFNETLQLDPQNASARFYLGLSAFQANDLQKASGIWQAMVDEAKGDEAWLPVLKGRLAEIKNQNSLARSPQLDEETIEEVESLDVSDQVALINSMIASLASRLEEEPDDKQGWERLIRSYIVLKDGRNALDAIARAKSHFANDTEFLQKLTGIENSISEVKGSE